MTRIQGLAVGVFAAGLLLPSAAQSNNGDLQIAGQWSLAPAREADRVQLTLHWKSAHRTMNSTMDWQIDRLEGLSPTQFKSSGTSVQFRIAREAGSLNCEGYLKSGSGGGVFTFTVNRSFVDAKAALGYRVPDDQAFAAAVHDVTTSYVKEMRGEGIQVDGFEKLLPTRIHNLTVEYVREMRQLGFPALTSERLITTRIHGVTPEYIRKLRGRGMKNLSVDQLASLRIHNIVE